MKASFVIDGRLPGLNEVVLAARGNRYAGATQKKKETVRCQWAIVGAGLPKFEQPVRISFAWHEKDLRRDPDNICAGAKFVLDALVTLGKIPNDTRQWIKGITHDFPPADKEKPRVEITIEEA